MAKHEYAHIRVESLSVALMSEAGLSNARSVSNNDLDSPRWYRTKRHLAARLRSGRPGEGYGSEGISTFSSVASTEACVSLSVSYETWNCRKIRSLWVHIQCSHLWDFSLDSTTTEISKARHCRVSIDSTCCISKAFTSDKLMHNTPHLTLRCLPWMPWSVSTINLLKNSEATALELEYWIARKRYSATQAGTCSLNGSLKLITY